MDNGRTAERGRPRLSSRRDIEQVALELFADKGFEATTVDDIAAAAGIGRRTFFRYYDSKNDVVWGEFDAGLADLARWLDQAPAEQPLMEALTAAVVRFNALDPTAEPAHRLRMTLILRVPALQAHSTLRYAAWRDVIARFAGKRLGQPVDALEPQLLGHTALAAALAAYEQWLAHDGASLTDLLRESFGLLSRIDAYRSPQRTRRRAKP